MRADPDRLEVLVGIPDIVDLAGVKGPAAVTNWRARYPTFPEARVQGTQPRFELEEILDWLRHDGPRGRSVPDPDPMWRWERLVGAFGAAHSSAEARTSAAALVAVRQLLGGDEAWRKLTIASEPAAALRVAAARAARMADEWSPTLGAQLVERLEVDTTTAAHLRQLAAALEAALAESGIAPWSVLDAVLDIRSNERLKSPHRTRPVLARMMVSMLAVDGTDTVFDPAAGEGDVLDECARRTDGRAVLHGQEYDAGATFIATVRMVARGVRAELAVPGHDSLRDDQFDGQQFSVVVIDPPVGGEYPLSSWIRHAVAHLRADGRLVMALPLADLASVAAARRQPDKRLQAYLSSLLGGRSSDGLHLDGVAVMPRGLRTDIVGPVALVALSGPARTHRSDEVPVAWIGSRSSVEGVVTTLDDAMGPHGVRGLLEVESPNVIVQRSSADGLFGTLHELVERSEREASSGRVVSGRAPSRDDDTVESAFAEPVFRAAVSSNSMQALMSDSLTADRTATRWGRRLESRAELMPRRAAAAYRLDDVLPEQADEADGAFEEPVDTAELRRALDELGRLVADARDGRVQIEPGVMRRMEGVASRLAAAVAAIDRVRSPY